MRLDEPAWWYLAEPDYRARLLGPAAGLYAWAAKRRMQQAPEAWLPIPVVCVGNFTAGGTGKTPLSIHICEHFKRKGLSPVFLTRGYGGSIDGPAWLEPERHKARDTGDEPLLLARSAPVMIARDRAAGARAIRDGKAHPADVVIMDDGLQNPALKKSLRIAVVDKRRGFGNGLVIPAGPLRAPLMMQLGLADAIVINTPPGEPPDVESEVGGWLRERFPGPVIEGRATPKGDVAWLAGTSVVAFAGIANPARFFALVEALGATLTERFTFADHHAFTLADAGRLIDAAKRHAAALVTTEKDWVRLAGETGALQDLREAVKPVAIGLEFGPRDAERLATLLDGAAAIPPSQPAGAYNTSAPSAS